MFNQDRLDFRKQKKWYNTSVETKEVEEIYGDVTIDILFLLRLNS